MAVLAISGNLLVLMVVYKCSTLQIVSNYFIVSLAMADFLVGLLVNPVYVAMLSLRAWVSEHTLYRVENFLWAQSLVATTYSLCAISVDRWLALSWVYFYKENMTQKVARAIILAIWIFSVLVASLGSLVTTSNDFETASVFWNACTLLTVALPLALIAFCYYRIFRITLRQRNGISARCFPSHFQTEEVKQFLKNKKAAGTFGIVVGLFALFFTPNLVFSCVELATKDSCQKKLVYRYWLWGIAVAHLSSVVNPFVYGARSREFRAAFKRVLKRR